MAGEPSELGERCMESGLTGKVVAITGGCGGLGTAFARRFAAEGAKIALLDIAIPEDACARALCSDDNCIAIQCDLSNDDQVIAAAQAVLDRFGRCDILINNAGYFPVIPFEDLSIERWRHTFAINVDSMFTLSQIFSKSMADNGWGRIINISSIQFWSRAVIGPHYTGSKGAVIGLTRALADALGSKGITVNSIAPGIIATDAVKASVVSSDLEVAARQRQAVPRIGQPDDLAGLAVFLASDAASFISAQTIAVDGGINRR